MLEQFRFRVLIVDASPSVLESASAIDHTVIADLRAACGELDDLIETALEDLARHLARLRQALTDGDGKVVRTEAHTLAGAFGALGAGELMRLARALEALGKSGNLGAAPLLLAAIETEAGRVERELNALLGRAAADTPER